MLEVRLPGRFVWGVRANDAQTQLVDVVAYGRIPSGYSQYVPEVGPPEPLQVGKVYDVTCTEGTAAFLVTATGIEKLSGDDPRARVRACDCPPPDSPVAAFNKAVAVFVGQVVRDELIDSTGQGADSYRKITFAVSKSLKGTNGSQTVVMNGSIALGVDCTFDFKQGGTYLVFAQRGTSSAALTVDRCSRIQLLDANARREVSLLEEEVRAKKNGQ